MAQQAWTKKTYFGARARQRSIGAYINDSLSPVLGAMPNTPAAFDNYAAMVRRAPTNILDDVSWGVQGWSSTAASNVHAKGAIYHAGFSSDGGTIPTATWTCANVANNTVGGWTATADGQTFASSDAYITRFANDSKAWGHPFFLRFDPEMNMKGAAWGVATGSVNANTASDYVAMWQHVYTLFKNAGNTNAIFVWCPNILQSGQDQTTYTALYPGDAYVDWIGLDGYNNATSIAGYQQTAGNTAGVSGATPTLTDTLSKAILAGDCVTVWTFSGVPACTCSSVGDGTNTYTKVAAAVNASGGEMALFVALNCAAVPSPVLTGTWSNPGGAAVNVGLNAVEYSNVSAVDVNATGTGTGNVSLTTPAATGAQELAIASVFHPTASQPYTLTASGWADRGNGSAARFSRDTADLLNAGIGTAAQTVTWTNGQTSNPWSAIIATLTTTGQGSTWRSFTSLFLTSYQAVLAIAPSKPLMIAEFGCSELGGDKAAWISSTFESEIPGDFSALSLVNWWDNDKTASGETDWRVNSSASSLSAFQRICSDTRWAAGTPLSLT